MDQETRLLFGPAQPGPDTVGAFGRTLKIALAMKGGVSLAVWIGGAVAELDVFRRIRIVGSRSDPTALLVVDPDSDPATPDEVVTRAASYARLLVSRGYDRVEFDVLAGASAGGLNAVLYSTAQRAGAAVDGVLTTWLDAGDIWKLLRKPSLWGVESVLTGDGYFWPSVKDALVKMLERGRNPKHRVDRIVVDLSATVVDHDDPRAMGNAERAGHFHFVADEARGKERFGRAIPETPDDLQRIERLAYAARTTSSFPGAFEPALIWSHPVAAESYAVSAGDVPIDGRRQVDMSFAFHAQRTGNRPFRVIDGGVTDNIPIDRALRAVRDVPGGTHADRVILYLEPDPAEESRSLTPSQTIDPPSGAKPEVRRKDRASRWLGTILSGLSLRGIRESGPEKVADVERTGRDLALDRGRELGYVPPSDTATWDRTAANAAYIRFRAVADHEHLSRVLADPSLWQLGTSIVARVSRRSAPHAVYGPLDTVLRSRYSDAAERQTDRAKAARTAILRGPQALLDNSRVALSWLRELEEDAFVSGDVSRFGDIRAELAEIAGSASAERDRLYWEVLEDPVLDASSDVDPEKVDPLVLADRIVDRWIAGGETEGTGDLWRRLGAQRTKLARFAMTGRHWAGFPSSRGFRAGDLAPYSAIRGIPETLPGLGFWSITAAERPAIDFGPLRRGQLAGVLETWMRLPRRNFREAAVAANLPDRLDAEAKLAGSSLAHFGAFFSQDWRRNDWWWGRLDAAAGFVRLLGNLDPMRVEAQSTAAGTSEAGIVHLAQVSILDQAASRSDRSPFRPLSRRERRNGLAPALPDRMVAGAHSIRNLKPGYLLAIASRGLRIVVRALGRRISPVAWLASRLFLPPLLVVLPLVAHPLRAAAVVALLLTGAAAVNTMRPLGPPDIGAPPNPDGSVPPVLPPSFTSGPSALPATDAWVVIGPHVPAVLFLLGIVALIVAAVVAFGRSFVRWAVLRELDVPTSLADTASAPTTVGAVLGGHRRRSLTFATVMLLAAPVLLLLAIDRYISDYGLSAGVWIFALSAAAAAAGARSASSRLQGQAVHPASSALWVVIAGAGAIAGLASGWAGAVTNAISIQGGMLIIWFGEVARTLSLSTASSGSTLVPWTASIFAGICGFFLSFILGWGWLGGVVPTTGGWRAWVGMVGALGWLLFVAAVTGIFALAAGIAVEAGTGAGGILAIEPAIQLAAWFVGSHVFWWLGETRMARFSKASDRPSYAEV